MSTGSWIGIADDSHGYGAGGMMGGGGDVGVIMLGAYSMGTGGGG